MKIIVWKIPHKYIKNVILFHLHMWIRGKEIPVATKKRTAIIITLTIRCNLIWCHKQCSLCHVFSLSNMYVNYESYYEIRMQVTRLLKERKSIFSVIINQKDRSKNIEMLLFNLYMISSTIADVFMALVWNYVNQH